MIELFNKKSWLIAAISVLAIVFTIPIFYFLWLNSIFSCEKIDDDRCIYIYEKYTQTNFSKSGIVLKKDNLCGLNDGWEAAIIKVTNKNEFQTLKREVKNKSFISTQLKKLKVGYFGSGIQKGYGVSDTIINNFKERFTLEFVNESQIGFFEKNW